MDFWYSEAMLALYGTIFGGVGLKVVEAFLGRFKNKDDTATALRAELRQELSNLRDEARKLREEVDEHDEAVDQWRMKYWSLLAAVATQDDETIRKHLNME